MQFIKEARVILKRVPSILLVFIILVGTALRFTNVNWDSFQAFHSDERNISWAVTRIHFFDQLNPKFFAYGGLPIYLYRGLGEGVVFVTKDPSWLTDWGKIAVIGRYVSATISSVSILLIYLVGFLYFSETVGIFSAFFLAFSPWAIREAHFATTETMLVFFLLCLLITTELFFRKPTKKRILPSGIILGLALAAKTTSLLFLLVPLTAVVLISWINMKRPHDAFPRIAQAISFILLLGSATASIFLLFSPYTILDWPHFKKSMQYESGVALGTLPVPYTLQFRHTTPYLYQLTTMLWQAGFLPVVGVVGLGILAMSLLKTKRLSLATFLIFPLVYGAFVGHWYAKFGRYNDLFLPFATLGASWLIWWIIKKSKIVGAALLVLTLTTTMLWGLANWTIFLQPQTRIEASRWMYQHIPQTAIIYTEHWNDGIPVTIMGIPNINFRRHLLTVYEPDNAEKLVYYGEKLSAGDFIILSTRRIWATMPRLTDKYPITSLFYRKLLSGELGYKEVARFTSYPKLFGYEVNDDTSEESVQVFDHPTVLIFQNKEKLSKEMLMERLRK